MKLYKKKSSSAYRNMIFSILIFAAIIAVFVTVMSNSSQSIDKENLAATEAAINKAVITCFAVEGFYPPDVKYIEDHYGVLINHEKYVVFYDGGGGNLMPSVNVVRVGSSYEE